MTHESALPEENISFIFEYLMTSSEPQRHTGLVSNSYPSMQVTTENRTQKFYGNLENTKAVETIISPIKPQRISQSGEATTHSITRQTSQQETFAVTYFQESMKNSRTLNSSPTTTSTPRETIIAPDYLTVQPLPSEVSGLPNSKDRNVTPVISQYIKVQPIVRKSF
ncbi:hypothetical protein KIN20_017820 [Parelaphostrongylus tenuis]|uniref:Uncharacterized protein n=1 Tax=Parelaphostrongylus tenuis TaxID=148309 RepID=A0AAD5MIE9_PARTN|nr:hypothetical protein KIN20_017820 [Parelaphostrongylus tenuis]